MSWTDKIKDQLIITTGDGKQYTPDWLNAEEAFEFNVSRFEFPEVGGELVKRKKVKARSFPLELYFQGDDHLDTFEAFRQSSHDERPWIISHPLYGSIICEPLSVHADNSKMNVTKVTITVIETITDNNPKTTVDPSDNIDIIKENLDEVFSSAYDVTPTAADINSITASNKTSYKKGIKIIKIPAEAEAYFNIFNKANSAVNNATASPLLAMRAVQSLINAPALFTSSVKDRIGLLSDQYHSLRASITGITKKSSKKTYENMGGNYLSAQAQAASKPGFGDYKNKIDVIIIIQIIINNYNLYLQDLDGLQSANGASPDSYIPDANSLIGLSELVNITVSSLFTIALGARQERSVILEEDSNWILLTHRFYGLDPLDDNINELMLNNSAGLDSVLQIKKGTKIIYYI